MIIKKSMTILNFSHPLTDEQLDKVREITGMNDLRVFDVKTHFDNDKPFLPQLAGLVAKIPISERDLQTEPILIVPPALNFITAMLLAHLHGVMGYFPPVIRISPVADSIPRYFEVAEILNLQTVRDMARKSR